MNAYDFDKTIYHYDCTLTFYRWCCIHYPRILLRWPSLAWNSILKMLGRISKHVYMERFYRYLHDVPDVAKEVELFWDKQQGHMHAWYADVQKPDDLVISASPYFLVRPIADRLGIRNVLASPLNPKTGLYEGERCHGEGKVRAFLAAYPNAEVDTFYSDSKSDAPMAGIAKKAYLVKGETLTDWPD